MKVKLFANSDLERLEAMVNDWLEDNELVTVKFTNLSEDEGGWTMAIFYTLKGLRR